MNKKLLSILLVLMMVLLSSTALAAATPSKELADLTTTKVLGSVAASGLPLPSNYANYVVEGEFKALDNELAKVLAFVNTAPVADYFGAEVKAQMAALLPENFDLSTLVMNEFFGIGVLNYVEGIGDVAATFECATTYSDTDNLIALMGKPEADNQVTWFVLKAEVKDGNVVVHFTTEALLALAQGDCMLAILND